MSEEKFSERSKKHIVFNCTKRETHHPNNGFKKLCRRLRNGFQLSSNKDEITREIFNDTDLMIIGDPREPFNAEELDSMKQYLTSGGRIIIFMGDGGEHGSTNINSLTKDFGMTVNSDSVMRSIYYKYMHPKEVFIAEGILVPDVARKKNSVTINGKRSQGKTKEPATTRGQILPEKLNFVFPYGASLSVSKPARPLLSSGPVSYPMNRPIASAWEAETVSELGAQRGRLVVCGSVDIFSDDWLDKEENAKLCDVILAWLLNEVDLDMTSDRQDSELSEYVPVPHVESLSESLKPCLQGLDELPRDPSKLFDSTMFKFDVDFIPQTVKMYEALGVAHEPLTLIPPQFVCPLPKMSLAVFPPVMREPADPALDQFDLDEHFAKEGLRLAQLTNKCTSGEEDLEYFISEAGEILGIMQDLPFGERSAKHILSHVLKYVVDFKKQEGPTLDVPVQAAESYLFSADDDQYDMEVRSGSTTTAAVHTAHVDLAPMKSAGTGRLQALDPNMHIGGASIGAPGKGGLGRVSFDDAKSDVADAKGTPLEGELLKL
jgi:intraflagellar transport protein 52